MISAREFAQTPERAAIVSASSWRPIVLGCFAEETSLRECEFGRSTSSTTIVLFGDSHAGQWLSAFETGKGPSYANWEEGMYKTFEILEKATEHTVLLRNTPVPDVDVPSCLLRPSISHLETRQRCNSLRASALDEKAFAAERDAAQSFRHLSIIDLVNDFCDQTICPARQNGIVVYRDSDHISDDFARSLSSELARHLVLIMSDDKTHSN
jgi:hypothetical protein